jgi:hypothetical protein
MSGKSSKHKLVYQVDRTAPQLILFLIGGAKGTSTGSPPPSNSSKIQKISDKKSRII